MPTGTVTTYDLTEGVIVDIDPLIRLLSPHEVPLLSSAGSDGRTVLSMDSCFEKKIEWQDDTLLTPTSNLDGGITNTITTLKVTDGEQLRFAVGDVLLLGSEKMRVTAYGSGTDELDVTRGVFGTSAAAHSDGDLIVNLGAALPEGSDAPEARSKDWENRFNLTSIFGPTSVHVSGTEQAIRKYGLATTQFDYQLAHRFREENIKLEHQLWYGTRFEDTTNKWRQMGGMNFYITTNVDSTTTTITSTALLDQIEDCWTAGGNPNKAAMGSKQKRKISDFDSSNIRLGRTDNGRGQTVDFFDTDFGRLDFILDRNVRPTDIFIYDREQAVVKTLRPWQFKMLGDTGDSTKGMLVAEKTFKFEAERWAARFSGLVDA